MVSLELPLREPPLSPLADSPGSRTEVLGIGCAFGASAGVDAPGGVVGRGGCCFGSFTDAALGIALSSSILVGVSSHAVVT